jgi:hypothetical protein
MVRNEIRITFYERIAPTWRVTMRPPSMEAFR